MSLLPGFVPTACYQWVPWEQGRSDRFLPKVDRVEQAHKARTT